MKKEKIVKKTKVSFFSPKQKDNRFRFSPLVYMIMSLALSLPSSRGGNGYEEDDHRGTSMVSPVSLSSASRFSRKAMSSCSSPSTEGRRRLPSQLYYSVLSEVAVKEAPFTHLLMVRPWGRFRVQNTQSFWEKWEVDRQRGTSLTGLLETPQEVQPILVDIDLSTDVLPLSGQDHLYSRRMVTDLVECFQTAIREMWSGILTKPQECSCFLLEKPIRHVKTNGGKEMWKNGFHLHFPCLWADRPTQHALFCQVMMIWKEKKMDRYKDMPSIEQFLDLGVVQGHGSSWLLYGMAKSEEEHPYQVTAMLRENGEWLEGEDWPHFFDLLEYNIYDKQPDGSFVCIPLETKEDILVNLPRILSIHLGGREEYVLPGISMEGPASPLVGPSSLRQNQTLQESHARWEQVTSTTSSSRPHAPSGDPKGSMATTNGHRRHDDFSMDDVRLLMTMVSKDRASRYDDWMTVGWLLYNLFQSSEEGLQEWLLFSRQDVSKFNEAECRYQWSKMKLGGLTIGTLRYLARTDSPLQYKEFTRQRVKTSIEQAFRCQQATHYDIAVALYEHYSDEFVCASIRDRIWYRFHNHVWHRTEEGVTLRQKISTEIISLFEGLYKETVSQERFNDTDATDRYLQQQRKHIQQILRNLKSSSFKANVMREASDLFYDETFMNRLDEDPGLFAFSNGVFDLRKSIFRSGLPSDMLSVQSPVAYRDHFTEDSPAVRDVWDFFEKVFPDRSVRSYFLDHASELFFGRNFRKHFQVWTGDGDNGKSVTQKLFEHLLGKYSVKLPTSLITGKRTQSSGACPELARTGSGVRLAMLQEPDMKDVVNVGILKELSGNDSFFARGLYSQGREVNPMFKLVLICNEPPKLPNSDAATWNRIRVIPFEATFCRDAPTCPEEQLRTKMFPRDDHFDEKIPKMVEALAWVLLGIFRELYKKHADANGGYHPPTVNEPEKVLLATQLYRQKNDWFRYFADEFVVKEAGSSIHITDAFSFFKEWAIDSFGRQFHIPARMEFQNLLEKYLADKAKREGHVYLPTTSRSGSSSLEIPGYQIHRPDSYRSSSSSTSSTDRGDTKDSSSLGHSVEEEQIDFV